MASLKRRCQESLRTGAGVDNALVIMRRAGQSQIASISLLMELTGMSLADAKRAVHTSPAWADLRGPAENLQEQLEQTAKQQSKRDRAGR